jgi:nitroimidazol reductase NimA-like FMN-containing flavoprotein (pyridoxamine 5'-phosphate oxidase superfamily)
MRRKEREIKNNKEIEEIINCSHVCRIALSENGLSYIIPVCFGYSKKSIYFHCANAGKKIDLIKKNNKVCFEFDIYEGLITNGNPCDWDVRYKSVIGYGKAFFIGGAQEKINALNIILRHYSEESFAFPENSIQNVTVIKVEIEELTGKRSG